MLVEFVRYVMKLWHHPNTCKIHLQSPILFPFLGYIFFRTCTQKKKRRRRKRRNPSRPEMRFLSPSHLLLLFVVLSSCSLCLGHEAEKWGSRSPSHHHYHNNQRYHGDGEMLSRSKLRKELAEEEDLQLVGFDSHHRHVHDSRHLSKLGDFFFFFFPPFLSRVLSFWSLRWVQRFVFLDCWSGSFFTWMIKLIVFCVFFYSLLVSQHTLWSVEWFPLLYERLRSGASTIYIPWLKIRWVFGITYQVGWHKWEWLRKNTWHWLTFSAQELPSLPDELAKINFVGQGKVPHLNEKLISFWIKLGVFFTGFWLDFCLFFFLLEKNVGHEVCSLWIM